MPISRIRFLFLALFIVLAAASAVGTIMLWYVPDPEFARRVATISVAPLVIGAALVWRSQ